MRTALHTRVREEPIAQHEAAHREAPVLDARHNCSEAGAEAGPPVVWQL